VDKPSLLKINSLTPLSKQTKSGVFTARSYTHHALLAHWSRAPHNPTDRRTSSPLLRPRFAVCPSRALRFGKNWVGEHASTHACRTYSVYCAETVRSCTYCIVRYRNFTRAMVPRTHVRHSILPHYTAISMDAVCSRIIKPRKQITIFTTSFL
jgi:hypothetical protein